MPKSLLRMFKSVKEFVPEKALSVVPRRIRGIYALFESLGENQFKVKYIGISERSVKGRIAKHARSKNKMGHWDCFSVYEVHDNISDEEIKELESLLLFIYRKDPNANLLNAQRSAKAFRALRKVPLGGYGPPAEGRKRRKTGPRRRRRGKTPTA